MISTVDRQRRSADRGVVRAFEPPDLMGVPSAPSATCRPALLPRIPSIEASDMSSGP